MSATPDETPIETPEETIDERRHALEELRQEHDAALAQKAELSEALARRNSEYGERIEHQAATIDVLKAMSASPGDPQPVFDLIAQRAMKFCGSSGARLVEFDGKQMTLRAMVREGGWTEEDRLIVSQFPLPPSTDSIAGTLILERRIVHIRDREENQSSPIRSNRRSVLGVPLLRGEAAIGGIFISKYEPGGFSDSQVELLKTFAEQAVIAITSADTYRALQTRTADLQESLEYQTATSDVLKVISRTTFDLKPTLEMLAETAVRLCNADQAVIARVESNTFRYAADFGFPPEYGAYQAARGAFPIDRAAPNVSARAVIEGRAVHIHDTAAVPGYPQTSAQLGRQRTALGVPFMRNGEPIGVIVLARQRVEPFTERQIDLVSTFADQAVIAIENTRLITEQREALEQQTATAEVLQVINASPGDLTPVFDAILEKAHRLCGADLGSLVTYDGEFIQAVATRGCSDEYDAIVRQPRRPGTSFHLALLRGEPFVHVHDVTSESSIGPDTPGGTAHPLLNTDARTILCIALRKDGALLGILNAFRREVRPFSGSEIALLRNFAAQAVIAMENARLLTEQHEALEQQTATAEVLQVINASPGDLTPVFDAMLEKGMRLCDAAFGVLRRFDGKNIQFLATRGVPAAYADYIARNASTPMEGTGPAVALETGRPAHTLDVREGAGYKNGDPAALAVADLGGARTMVHVPLVKDQASIGLFSFYRQEVRAFSEKQQALLENFAAQAVIAMENARLITETQEALEQQTATAEVLQVINANPGDLAPVFDAMLEKAMRLCEADFGLLSTFDGERFHSAANRAIPATLAAYRTRNPPDYGPGTAPARLRAGERIVHSLDMKADEAYQRGEPNRRAIVDLGGARTALTVALRKDDTLLGMIHIYRQEVRAFTGKQIALLENFAAQAVIAMENARLLRELRARTDDLQESLEYQTATSEVLKVISGSTFDLDPVFQAVVTTAARLCHADQATIYRYQDGEYRWAAGHGLPPEYEVLERASRIRPGNGTLVGRVALESRTVEILDPMIDPLYEAKDDARIGGLHTMLGVPLLRDGAAIGVIGLGRRRVEPYTARQIALVRTFADQAVIAIENSRLMTEHQEALEQQTATAEVLQVINASPGDLASVFDAMLEKAMRLCEAAFGQLSTFDGTRFHTAGTRGVPAAFAEYRKHNPPDYGPGTQPARLLAGEPLLHIADLQAEDAYQRGEANRRALVDLGGARTSLMVPLRKDGAMAGFIQVCRQEVRPFSDKQIALLENFAAQAVIAMENARLITETQEALEQQTATTEVLQVINASPGNLVPVFDAILEKAMRLCGVAFGKMNVFDGERHRTVATRGLPEPLAAYFERNPASSEHSPLFMKMVETKAPAHLLDTKAGPGYRDGYPVPRALVDLGGARTFLMLPLVKDETVLGHISVYRQEVRAFSDKEIALLENFAAQAVIAMENARLLDELRAALNTTQSTLRELKLTQANLIQAEKMASLGQLTAGIAHEIKNPLNFVNNFASLSVDLLEELQETAAPGFALLTEDQRADIEDVSALLTGNLQKITEHGKRADGIVRSMLEHSRGASGERRAVNINALADEALNLAFHGARALDPDFQITLRRDFAEPIAPIDLNPQDITRVLLNLFSNGFYAANKRAKADAAPDFEPNLTVATQEADGHVVIRVRDNGTGIPPDIREKLFQPFFTTKPTGEGTGLGLSITYDIVTKQHGGTIALESEPGAFTEFTVTLPRR